MVNPPAFPTNMFYEEKLYGCEEGMTLRDYFAAHAMQGLVANGWLNSADSGEISEQSYRLAHAMLKARNSNGLD